MGQVQESVANINCEIWENYGDDTPVLEYSFNGYAERVDFLGIILWSSEVDERKYDEESGEYENIELFLKCQVRRLVELISKIKL